MDARQDLPTPGDDIMKAASGSSESRKRIVGSHDHGRRPC